MNTAGIFLPTPCSPDPEMMPQIALCIPTSCCGCSCHAARWLARWRNGMYSPSPGTKQAADVGKKAKNGSPCSAACFGQALMVFGGVFFLYNPTPAFPAGEESWGHHSSGGEVASCRSSLADQRVDVFVLRERWFYFLS